MSATVLVSGAFTGHPGHGGATWAILQYLLGLRRLGIDVHLVEPVEEQDPAASRRPAECQRIMERFDLRDRWCLVGPGGATAGLGRQDLEELATRADLLLNVSGMLTDQAVLDAVPVRAYLDLDPAFIQLWHAADGVDMGFDAHTHFVSLSDAIGRSIPAVGREWIPTLPPVVLAHWPRAGEVIHEGLTTVANWRSYGSIHHDGVYYGQKAHSIRALLELPGRLAVPVQLALGIHPDEALDLASLEQHGWRLLDPQVVTGTPEAYETFVQGSWAELGVAKLGYVVSDSGWFSDRSACYLASGRPVIAEDTGFGRRLPVGDGLLSFRGVDDVVAAAEVLEREYNHHREAARSIAEDHLESDRVLTTLLDRVLA
jgi:hypothetical protein